MQRRRTARKGPEALALARGRAARRGTRPPAQGREACRAVSRPLTQNPWRAGRPAMRRAQYRGGAACRRAEVGGPPWRRRVAPFLASPARSKPEPASEATPGVEGFAAPSIWSASWRTVCSAAVAVGSTGSGSARWGAILFGWAALEHCVFALLGRCHARLGVVLDQGSRRRG